MALYCGTAGDVIVGGTSLEVKEWTASFSQGLVDVTNKGDSGWYTSQCGVKRCDANWTADWDSVLNTADPPSIAVGSSISLELELADGGDSISGTFTVATLEISSAVDGVVTYTCSCESSGQVYYPGESTS